MKIEPLLSPEKFVCLEGLSHLCTGGEGPWLKSHNQIYNQFSKLKSSGSRGRQEIVQVSNSCRRKIAQLWQVPYQRIAFMPSATEGMNWLARGLDWREGDNLVTPYLEFPSVAHAWRQIEKKGIRVKRVPARNWITREQDLLSAIDERTRLLAVSQVNFYTGQCLNIARLADQTSRKGVLLAVDATHSSGVIQVPAGLTDLCLSSSYKWMLGTHGVAPCYLSSNAENQLTESSFGWHNLISWPNDQMEFKPVVEIRPMPEKLEPGNPSLISVMFLNNSLDLILKIGIDRIQEHARQLSALIANGLESFRQQVITPSETSARSGNTSFLTKNPKAVQDHLNAKNVLVWGELGRVRVSGHFFNGQEDVENFLNALSDW